MIKHIVLKNFRNYQNLNIHFHPSNNLIIGNNGEGKTNILESIYMLSTMKSFRQNSYIPLIKMGENSFFIQSIIEHNNLTSTLEINYDKAHKIIKFNNEKIRTFSSIVGIIKTMLFKQDDLNLIYGSPSIRRELLDFGLCLSSQEYLNLLKNYNLLLKEKNKLLKNYNFSRSYLNILNLKFIDFASQIIFYRYILIKYLSRHLEKYFSLFKFKEKNITISYVNSTYRYQDYDFQNLNSIKDKLNKLLLKNNAKEILLKQAFIGPHKDDFLISLENQQSKNFASQGQIRIISFILKLILSRYIEMTCKEKVVLIFDDVFFDLDQYRQKIVFKFFKNNQKFFTMTHIKKKSIFKNSKIFYTCDLK